MKIQPKQIGKISFKIFRQALTICIVFSSMPALSAIPYNNAFHDMDLIDTQNKELDLSLLARIQTIIDQHQFNMANYIPLNNLPSNDDGNVIIRRVLKQTLKTVFESEAGVQSPLVHNAQNLNSSLVTSIDRHGQSVQFRLKAFESEAEISYKGYVTAALTYNAGSAETRVEVSRAVNEKTYAFTHVSNSTENIDRFGVQWNF